MLYKTLISTPGCLGLIAADRLLEVDEATVASELERVELVVDELLGVIGTGIPAVVMPMVMGLV
jgi:orotate phosphoribosyltransferase-like protein